MTIYQDLQKHAQSMRKFNLREDFEKEKFGNASRSVRDDFVKAEKIIIR